jgi:drug/metabolite transporter (DMT)-like permease
MSLTAPARPAAPTAAPSVAPPVVAPSRRLGVLAILVSAAGMSLSGLFGRMASPEGANLGEALTLGRMAVGALGMLAILAVTRRLSTLRVRPSRSVVLGGVFLGLTMATYLSATVLTDLSRAVVLHYLGPILSTVLARVVLKERVTAADALSLGLSFAGMLLTAELLGGETASMTRDDTLGTILGTASGIFYGAALFSYRFRADMPSDARSFWNFTFAAAATAGMVLLVRPDLSGMTAGNWAWAGGFFLVSGLLALGLLVVAGRHLRAAELSGLSFTEVVMASLVGAVVFGELFSTPMLVGSLLILVGAIVPLAIGIRSDRRAVRSVS